MTNSATKRTMNLLADSCKKLLKEKDLNKITINELSAECGVNRQTFYYHFHDIYDLCSYMIERDFNDLFSNHAETYDWKEIMLKLAEYLQENRSMYMKLLNSVGYTYVSSFMYSHVYPYIKSFIDSFLRGKKVDHKYVDFLYGFYTASFRGCIMQWILDGPVDNNLSAEEIVDMIHVTVSSSLESVIDNYLIKA